MRNISFSDKPTPFSVFLSNTGLDTAWVLVADEQDPAMECLQASSY